MSHTGHRGRPQIVHCTMSSLLPSPRHQLRTIDVQSTERRAADNRAQRSVTCPARARLSARPRAAAGTTQQLPTYPTVPAGGFAADLPTLP